MVKPYIFWSRRGLLLLQIPTLLPTQPKTLPQPVDACRTCPKPNNSPMKLGAKFQRNLSAVISDLSESNVLSDFAERHETRDLVADYNEKVRAKKKETLEENARKLMDRKMNVVGEKKEQMDSRKKKEQMDSRKKKEDKEADLEKRKKEEAENRKKEEAEKRKKVEAEKRKKVEEIKEKTQKEEAEKRKKVEEIKEKTRKDAERDMARTQEWRQSLQSVHAVTTSNRSSLRKHDQPMISDEHHGGSDSSSSGCDMGHRVSLSTSSTIHDDLQGIRNTLGKFKTVLLCADRIVMQWLSTGFPCFVNGKCTFRDRPRLYIAEYKGCHRFREQAGCLKG